MVTRVEQSPWHRCASVHGRSFKPSSLLTSAHAWEAPFFLCVLVNVSSGDWWSVYMWCEENEMNFTVMKWRRVQRGSRWFIPQSKWVCVSWLILKRWDSYLEKPVQFANQF